MSARYVLHPGPVISKHDGQRHYIGIGQLRRLYELRPSDRVVVADLPWYRPLEGDVHLYPRFNGDYGRPQ